MKKILLATLIASAFAAFALDDARAATENTDNKNGLAYGSAVARDTGYTVWDDKNYVELHGYKEFSLNYKVISAAADTLIFNVLGSNHDPDSLKYCYTIFCDTMLVSTGACTNNVKNDSTFVINLPYGTSTVAATLPRYLRVQVIPCDTTGGSGATATISDGFIAK